jgi:hypothetical protein
VSAMPSWSKSATGIESSWSRRCALLVPSIVARNALLARHVTQAQEKLQLEEVVERMVTQQYSAAAREREVRACWPLHTSYYQTLLCSEIDNHALLTHTLTSDIRSAVAPRCSAACR